MKQYAICRSCIICGMGFILSCLDYQEDEYHHTFGKKIKGAYKPASDFLFQLKSKVIIPHSQGGNGYIVDVYPEGNYDEVNTQPK